MITKTALITLVSTILVLMMAFGFESNRGRQNWGRESAGVTGASSGYSSGGAPSTWGQGSSGVTGASRGFFSGGEHDGWGGDYEGGEEGGDD